jgi:antitoxin YobK
MRCSMSMAELEQALEAAGASDLADFIGPRDRGLVTAAEAALGVSLPPTYRRFIAELGAGSFGRSEFYGAIDENFDTSSVPDAIWLTLDERRGFGLPRHLVIVGDTGMGGFYVLDTARTDADDECPVAVWVGGQSRDSETLEVVAPDFGSFFWSAVQKEIVA